MLTIAFGMSAYQATQSPFDEVDSLPDVEDASLDSLYVPLIDTEFVLKDSGTEKYLLARVKSPQPYTSLHVLDGGQSIGHLDSQGEYILRPPKNKLSQLEFIDLISGKKFE